MKTPDQVRLFVLRSKKEQKVIPLTMDSASWMGIFNCSQLKSQPFLLPWLINSDVTYFCLVHEQHLSFQINYILMVRLTKCFGSHCLLAKALMKTKESIHLKIFGTALVLAYSVVIVSQSEPVKLQVQFPRPYFFLTSSRVRSTVSAAMSDSAQLLSISAQFASTQV